MKHLYPALLLALAAVACQPNTESATTDELTAGYRNENDSTWYNRQSGMSYWLLQMTLGKADTALAFARTQLPDLEAQLMVAAAHAHLGQPDSAAHYANLALAGGLPAARFLAGDMEVFQPLLQLADVQKALAPSVQKLLHGPMVGAVTDSSAQVWARLYGQGQLVVTVYADSTYTNALATVTADSEPQAEGVARAQLQALQPGTTYWYSAGTAAFPHQRKGSFTTPPVAGQPTQLTVAFGACSAFIPWQGQVWSVMHSHKPQALLQLGDNVYIDYPEAPQVQQFCYHQRQSEEPYRRLVAHTPTYAIWDDHEFGKNDSYGTPALDTPAWKVRSLDIFKNQWTDPGYGGGTGLPGVFFKHSMGDVDFFFLDGRYYRHPSEVGNGRTDTLSMLGAQQKAWLKQELKASQATFKVLASSVPWSFGAKRGMAGRNDTWKGYPEERDELFSFLAQEDIAGVFLLAGDRHRSDHWEIAREGAYTLHEWVIGRLTNTHTHGTKEEATFSYNELPAFGLLHFDTKKADPEVRYEIWNNRNEQVYEYTLKLSALTGA